MRGQSSRATDGCLIYYIEDIYLLSYNENFQSSLFGDVFIYIGYVVYKLCMLAWIFTF